MKIPEKLTEYADILMNYNKKINLVSRKMTPGELEQLISESVLLNKYVSDKSEIIVDAGSGNGLLGIPVALLNVKKKIVLVEPKNKKSLFLQFARDEMKLENVEVKTVSIEEYLNSAGMNDCTVIARGFPRLEIFRHFLEKGKIREAILITSDNKIKKNQIHLEKLRKKIYNVPLRENLKILKLEKTERDQYESIRNHRHRKPKRRSR
jgi:16S rRNA G527 N7-methylase RsmG